MAPVLPAQPARHPLGQHELGPRHEHRPRALGGAAARDPADVRRERRRDRGHLLGLGRGRRAEHQRLRHRREPAHGGDLHERLHAGAPDPCGHPGAVPRLQHRPRADLDEVRRQSGARPRLGELPRPEGLPLHRPRHGRVLLGHGRGRGAAVPGRALPQRRPQDLDAPQRLRPRERHGRHLGMPRPVPARGRRRPGEHQVGAGREPEPRLGRRRLGRPVLRRRVRRHDLHVREHGVGCRAAAR